MTLDRKMEEAKSVPYSVLNIVKAKGLMEITRKALGRLWPMIISTQTEGRQEDLKYLDFLSL